MNTKLEAEAPRAVPQHGRLWQSGLLLSAASFITGLGNYAYQAIISRRLSESGDFGSANGALAFISLLSLPLTIATTAVTHYIARFNFRGDSARLHNLLAGCRRFLFRLTVGGSLFTVLLIKPAGMFFHFPRTSLLLVVLCCVWAGFWGAFATALCQGLAWFKRLALIGLLTMSLRLAFGGLITLKFPTAEMVVLASGVGLLANLILLYWKEELSRPSQHPESPWNREFVQFLIVSAACVGGGYFFTQGDLLVAKRNFSMAAQLDPNATAGLLASLDAYAAAGLLARALPMTVAPFLIVLFTHRSGRHAADSLPEQLKLLGLYAVGLVGGAIGLLLFRNILLNILGRNTAEAATMITALTLTMFFTGVLQALALWALASRWQKVALLYGGLGLTYWLVLLFFGTTPHRLLQVMPICAAAAFVLLFIIWLTTMRTKHRDDS